MGREFTTAPGRFNWGTMVPLIALVAAVCEPSWLSELTDNYCKVFPCARPASEAPGSPPYAVVLPFLYAFGCVWLLGRQKPH
jgi:hypothetical protein